MYAFLIADGIKAFFVCTLLYIMRCSLQRDFYMKHYFIKQICSVGEIWPSIKGINYWKVSWFRSKFISTWNWAQKTPKKTRLHCLTDISRSFPTSQNSTSSKYRTNDSHSKTNGVIVLHQLVHPSLLIGLECDRAAYYRLPSAKDRHSTQPRPVGKSGPLKKKKKKKGHRFTCACTKCFSISGWSDLGELH